MQALTKVLQERGVERRLQRIITVMPGVLFGFPPEETMDYVARIDCPTCVKALDEADELLRRQEEFEQLWKRWQKRQLRPSAKPDLETWHIEACADMRRNVARMWGCLASCPVHWTSKAERDLSKALIAHFIHGHHVMVL